MSIHSGVDMLDAQLPASEQVHQALNRVLLSPEFRSSQRECDFLRYVVEAALKGTADHLKERTIGMDVFGRDSTFEPSDESNVRVKARDIRKRLALYYASTRGSTDPVLIELPVGSYVPQFHWRGEQPRSSPPARGRVGSAAPPIHALHPAPSRHRLRGFGVTTGSAVLIAAAAILVYLHGHAPAVPTPLAQFWAPVLESVTPALILVAPVPIHSLQKDLNQGMRFTIDPHDEVFYGITENGVPTNWRISRQPGDPKLDEDFAIVSRISDRDTRQILVQVSGVSHYGAAAAGDFITDPELARQALQGAPHDSQQKNIQIVLHVRVISGTSAGPTVVATHFW
jgi:hypothetical protein